MTPSTADGTLSYLCERDNRMEFTLDWILKAAATVGFIYIILSLFNVHWLLRLRILGSMAVGAILIGFLLWPRIAPVDPFGPVTLFGGLFSPSDVILSALAALIAGAGGCLIAYPFGNVIGLLAVPAGLTVWALRGGTMRLLLLSHSTVQQRLEIYHFLRLEPLFWIVLLLFGAAGVWLASKVIQPKIDILTQDPQKSNSNWTSMIVAVLASVVIVMLTIGLFAQDVSYPDAQIGKVTGQPGTRQVAFAVLASFAVAGFLIKLFLDCDHYLAVAAGPILYFFVISKTCNPQMMQYMSENWAIAYFPNALSAILPIQLIAVAPIGALAGQWLAVKINPQNKLYKVR